MEFDKSAAIGFIIGYFILGTGIFPVVREGFTAHLLWLTIGLGGAVCVGFILGSVIKFIKFNHPNNIK